MEVRSPCNEDRGNRCARALWQKWVVRLKETEDTDTVGPHYEMRPEGRK